ncbi:MULTISPECIES: hypothetical protein [unclassified Streptomyces]|uniref:hypothetical protein n=1 Tax=unclassified Streptomyces TaxID=2593676 RepID=UPI0033EA555C
MPLTTPSAFAAEVGTTGFGPTKCTNIGNGDLCTTGISGSPAGYDVAYNKKKGSPVTVRFRLQCVGGFKAADNGSFTISQGQRRSFVFSVGDKGQCQSVLQDITNAQNFYGPYVTIP